MKTIIKAFVIFLAALQWQSGLWGQTVSRPKVLMLGGELKPLAKAWRASGVAATIVEIRDDKDFPKDAQRLASQCDLVVLMVNHVVSDGVTSVLESFVRGGGGLILSVPDDWRGKFWHDSAGSALDLLSPSLAVDFREQLFPQMEWNDRYQGPRFDLSGCPKLKRAFNATTPEGSPLCLFNMLSPVKFSKPVWNRDWESPLVMAIPAKTSILSTASYGLGKTLFFGGSVVDDALLAWKGYPAMCQWMVAKVAPSGNLSAASDQCFSVKGFRPPVWWELPLSDGMKAEGQKEPLETFFLPPDSLADAGYLRMSQDAPTVFLFGKEADSKLDAWVKTAVRIPWKDQGTRVDGCPPREKTEFDAKKLTVLARAENAVVVSSAHSTNSRPFPCKIECKEQTAPVIGFSGSGAQINLPEKWKIAYTYDPDSDRDFKEGWQNPAFDDSSWTEEPLGRKTASVFGRKLGYDGAIWYRAWLDISKDAMQPGSMLAFESDCHHIRVYVDGKEMLFEPGLAQMKPALALSRIGEGRHLVAVRTYGELRANYGLIKIVPVQYPIFWKPDPRDTGWAEGAREGFIKGTGWTPAPWLLDTSPLAMDSTQGWVSFPVVIPEGVSPFDLVIGCPYSGSKLFVNGSLFGQQDNDRCARYVVPGTAFNKGNNIVSLWMQKGRRVSTVVLPAERVTVKCSVNSPVDGAALLASVNDNGNGRPSAPYTGLSVKVNGVLMGAQTDGNGPNKELFAPMCLKNGENEVELTAPAGAAGSVTIESVAAVSVPDGMTTVLPAWERTPAGNAPLDWYLPSCSTAKWEPTPMDIEQEWRRNWMGQIAPQISDGDFLYRAWLRVPEKGVPFLSLFMRNASVKFLLVNGKKISPLQIQGVNDRCLYPLGGTLKPGLNLIAIAPDRSTYKDFQILMPGGREGKSGMPELVTGYAPLEPAVKELSAYKLNVAFKRCVVQAPPGAETLFKWPDGTPAIVQVKAADLKSKEILVAPGLFDDMLPGAFLAKKIRRSGAVCAAEYDYAQRICRDYFLTDKEEQLLPALAAYAEGAQARISHFDVTGSMARVSVASQGAPTVLAWRFLDWQGKPLGSGTSAVKPQGGLEMAGFVPIPDTRQYAWSEGTPFSKSVRLRVALMSPDFKKIYGFIEKAVEPEPRLQVALRLPDKLSGLSEETAPFQKRILHSSIDTLVERRIFLPSEKISFKVYVVNNEAKPVDAAIRFAAAGALSGATLSQNGTLKLLPYATGSVDFTLPAASKQFEEPWSARAEVWLEGGLQSQSNQFFTVASPKGEMKDFSEASREGRFAGGYMWQMQSSAYAIEHRTGYDALPAQNVKNWWAGTRYGADGNWLLAEGIHRGEGGGDQNCLLWGPFYEQLRGEIIDSYGWFPNGEPFRQWWAPYARRELMRKYGRRAAIVSMSDWWQYECGPAEANFGTMQAFDRWLKDHKGQSVAGVAMDGSGLRNSTLRDALKKIGRGGELEKVYAVFNAETLAADLKLSNDRFCEVAPGTGQEGQGCFSGVLPSTPGGAKLASEWTKSEVLGTLDADNHPCAGPWQYAIEACVIRALGINFGFDTNWERPQRYHYNADTRSEHPALGRVPLDSSMWARRILDSRWTAVADGSGGFAPVLNLTHCSCADDGEHHLIAARAGGNDYSGVLPHHWQINDILSQLSMTILPKEPLSPLLVVGEGGLNFDGYFGCIGYLRDAGLPLGGGVSSALLNTLDPEKTPGLIWASAAKIDPEAYASLRRLMERGVPVLFIGNLPEPLGSASGLPADFKLSKADLIPSESDAFAVSGEGAGWSELDGLPGTKSQCHFISTYAAAESGVMKPLISKGGILVLGKSDKPDRKAVFLANAYPPRTADDQAPIRAAVRAFRGLMRNVVSWPDGVTGYAFKGLDGKTYAVVENLTDFPITSELTIHASKELFSSTTKAASLLSGESLNVRQKAGDWMIAFSVPAKSGDVVVINP